VLAETVNWWFALLFVVWCGALMEGSVILAATFWKFKRYPKWCFTVAFVVTIALFAFTSYVVEEYMRSLPS